MTKTTKNPLPYQDAHPDAFIFDIDGTLAHRTDRGPYDWGKVEHDTVDEGMRLILKSLWGGHAHIIIVSGRDASCLPQTQRWLTTHGIPYELLLMRPEGDKRKDCFVKEELHRAHIEGRYNVLGVFDDRGQTVNMWRSIGHPCYQVAPGDF